MDLYFHTSSSTPKKKIMLLSSLRKKRTGSSVGTELSLQPKKLVTVLSSTTVTDYLQKSTLHAKKVWNQFIPSQAIRKMSASSNSKTSSTVLFDSTEHLKTLSAPPTPPPKKSYTMPNLMIITDDLSDPLMHRALPSLPSSMASSSASMDKSGMTRAKTWIGNSIQKWLSSADAEEKRKMAILLDHSELDEEEEQSILHSSTLISSSSSSSKKMTLHCRILQVTNLASSKNYQYTMRMRVTNNATQTHSGVMKRVAKGVSAAHPRAALSFNVQGRFQLECDLGIKPCSSANLLHRIKSLTSKTNLSTMTTEENQDGEEEEGNDIKGQLVLDSGDEPLAGFANKGIGQYTIQTSALLALELTMAFWLEENHDQEEEEEEEDMDTTLIDQDVLRYCQAGDYLTFYVKGESYPMWIRYWVSYRNNQLILRSNERGGGEPVDKISLRHLTQVNINPSDDIQEDIYLGKKHGIVLSFGGKFNMYLFGDHSKSVRFWKCLLDQHTVTTATTASITKKYLWVAQ